MSSIVSQSLPQVYTPDQVAQILQLSTNTVYGLINRGEIIAKRLGKTLRIPATSLSFALSGLDADLFAAEKEDRKNIKVVNNTLSSIRARL